MDPILELESGQITWSQFLLSWCRVQQIAPKLQISCSNFFCSRLFDRWESCSRLLKCCLHLEGLVSQFSLLRDRLHSCWDKIWILVGLQIPSSKIEDYFEFHQMIWPNFLDLSKCFQWEEETTTTTRTRTTTMTTRTGDLLEVVADLLRTVSGQEEWWWFGAVDQARWLRKKCEMRIKRAKRRCICVWACK